MFHTQSAFALDPECQFILYHQRGMKPPERKTPKGYEERKQAIDDVAKLNQANLSAIDAAKRAVSNSLIHNPGLQGEDEAETRASIAIAVFNRDFAFKGRKKVDQSTRFCS